MALEALREAIAELRQLADPQVATGPNRGELAIRLCELGSRIAGELDVNGGYGILRERSDKYIQEIETEFFQCMCDLAHNVVITLWKKAKDPGNPLPINCESFVISDSFDKSYKRAEGQWLLLYRLIPAAPSAEDSSRVSDAPPERTPLNLANAKIDLRSFGCGFKGPHIGHSLYDFVAQLKRLSDCLGESRMLRRLILYFESILTWSDVGYLRGSMLITGCYAVHQGDDSFHRTRLFSEWFKTNIHESARVMLAAAESAVKPIPDIVKDTEVAGREDKDNIEAKKVGDAVALPGAFDGGNSENTEATKTDSDSDAKYAWHKDEEPPERFSKTEFRGKQWQIAWALGEQKIIRSCLRKELIRALINEAVLWGKRKEGTREEVVVYVANKMSDRIPAAIDMLRLIQERGPYLHEDEALQEEYRLHEKRPLKSRSEEILAKVLFEHDILKVGTISNLHKTMKGKRGGLSGRFDHEQFFVLYLHKRFTKQKVAAIHKSLNKELKKPTQSDGPT